MAVSYKLASLILSATPQPCSWVSAHVKSGSSTFLQAATSAQEEALPPSRRIAKDGEGSVIPPGERSPLPATFPAQAPWVQDRCPTVWSHARSRVSFYVLNTTQKHVVGGRDSEAHFGSASGQPFPSNTGLWFHLDSHIYLFGASLMVQMVKNPPTMPTQVWSLGWEDLMEKGMATHSSTLAWRIAWTV